MYRYKGENTLSEKPVNRKIKPVQKNPADAPAKRPKPVTLVEVARAARVSKATASNVFSRPERVRSALRERVEEAARALGYAVPTRAGAC